MNTDARKIIDKGSAAAFFMRLGAALLVLKLATVAVQYAISYGIIGFASYDTYYHLATEAWWFNWLLSLIPLYCVAMPLFLLLLPKPVHTELERPAKKRMGAGALIGALCMCICVLYVGNIMGSSISSTVSELLGKTAENPLASLAGEGVIPMIATVLFGVIIGPVGEEIIFRRFIADRVAPFGEGLAILFSGLTFGLFHGNLFQFFYAFFIGCLLTFVRVRTGRDLYNMILHSAVNFFGMVVSPWALSGERLAVMERIAADPASMTEADIMLLLPTVFFAIAAFAVFVAGTVIFIVALSKGKFRSGGAPRLAVEGGTAKAIWLNPCVLISLVFMALFIVLYFVR